MGSIRTFVAVDISKSVRAQAKACMERLARYAADYKWVEPENLHVTLNFLGDVQEQQVPQVCNCIEKNLSGTPSFELRLNRVGAFPQPDRPRVVWMGIESEGATALSAIYNNLAPALEELGIPRDRQTYQPHLTLGRIRRGGRWSAELVDAIRQSHETSGNGCEITEVVVYSSFLERTGPSYTPMSRIRLT